MAKDKNNSKRLISIRIVVDGRLSKVLCDIVLDLANFLRAILQILESCFGEVAEAAKDALIRKIKGKKQR